MTRLPACTAPAGRESVSQAVAGCLLPIRCDPRLVIGSVGRAPEQLRLEATDPLTGPGRRNFAHMSTLPARHLARNASHAHTRTCTCT